MREGVVPGFKFKVQGSEFKVSDSYKNLKPETLNMEL